MRKTTDDVKQAFQTFADQGAVGRIFANLLPHDEGWFMWCERIIKLEEMDKTTANTVKLLCKMFEGATRIEILNKQGQIRVNVSRGIE